MKRNIPHAKILSHRGSRHKPKYAQVVYQIAKALEMKLLGLFYN